ncbi:tRNA lysidine(34) synthetase TilS [Flavobacterium amniphilum]|uniref:tRNA lysidine(34) synthetase TilS n=1 Tax=Flavobacterium amniphilum TaxID=1834035 RepID=UPI00202A4DD6|nr:tRNA lysidine(34) synthetase TilS [Flavobacterium amniphilum]MCL9805837.1 tRNA lysidine(34) synthetase TilS [Flavobacterium amniphilum]
MLQKFQNHIQQNFAFLTGKKLLLAVSGGIDSMVLTDLIQKSGFKIGISHCNFSLRGEESNEDFNFIESYCLKNNISFFGKKFNTKEFAEENKLSIQLAARKLRYDWFDELLETEGFDYLLTAHHLDDSAETFLINFTRGTGMDGLTGIPQQNGKIVRPLLIFLREEIESHAKENNITWREDSSNASDKYLRNKIRHAIIPILKELNPGFLSSFQNTIEHLQQIQSMVSDASETAYNQIVTEENGQIKINLPKLLELPNYKAYLYQWLQPYGFTAWEDIYDLTEAQSGKQVFSDTHKLLKDRSLLIISKIKEEQEVTYFIDESLKTGDLPVKLHFSDQNHIINASANTIFVDKLSLKFPLTLRKWQEGDYFYPSGMHGKKKVSKYFKDEKFSLIDKEDTWLLCSENQIIWIVNHRADQRFIANNDTQQILKIELQ